MSINPAWNQELIATRIEAWLQDQSNQEVIFASSVNALEEYASNVDSSAKRAASDMKFVFLWRMPEAIFSAWRGDPGAFDRLQQAHQYDVWRLRGRRLFFAEKRKSQFTESLRSAGLALARSLALGRMEEANRLGELIYDGFDERFIVAEQATYAGTFLLRLWADWKGRQTAFPGREFLELSEYQRVLDSWRDPDPGPFADAISAACDFHTHLSGPLSDEEVVDFWQDFYQIYPVEILAVLRLRAEAGLELPVVHHPLLRSRLALLPPPAMVDPDPLLSRVLIRFRADLRLDIQD